MGEDSSSSDWLPAGWKVESRVRRNGKKDKCYTDPSNEHKFYSKPEVIRYLKSVGIICEELTTKSPRNCSATKFVVKEAVAEGLPVGWIKEIRVTKKGNKIRRDPYYIDPVTGHLFRSMKEVSRYLDTGKMVKRSSKPKDQEPIEAPAEPGKEKSANNKVQKLDIENPNQETGEEAPATDHINQSQFDNLEQSENKEKSAAAEEAPAEDHINQSRFDNLEQRENKEKSSESGSPVVEDLQEKLQPDVNGVEKHGTECKKKRKNKKRGAELPRRTSKRLAGITIEMPVELKTRNRVHQAAATHMSQGETKCADNHQDSKISDENVEKVRTEHDADQKQENCDVLSPGDAGIQEEHAKQEVAECKRDEKQETPLDSSLKDLWKDPCIEFAIKTLTGAIPIVDEEKFSKDPVVSVDLPAAIPGNQDLPLGDIWADPCIEFAVKTLTGDVPIINNRDVQNIFQQPHYSSNFGGEKGLLPNFWSTERSPASVSYANSEQPFKQL